MTPDTIDHLKQQFNKGFSWNGTFYVFHKIATMGLTVSLYKNLSTNDFSAWANLQSIVYFLLLFLDCGFRKSVPRYCVEFSATSESAQKFLKTILGFQIILLTTLGIPLCYAACTILPTTHNHPIALLALPLLITEGSIGLLRLVFHSHFWIKQFAILTTAATIIEMICATILIMTIHQSTLLVTHVLLTKLLIGLVTSIIAWYKVLSLYQSTQHTTDKYHTALHSFDYQTTMRSFIKHSSMMWANNSIKSLSERNFMIPLLTTLFGAEQANIFKLANDGAVAFYRIVVKTLGVMDTAFFAQVERLEEAKKLMPIAFTKVMTSIAALCLPLSGIVVLLSVLPIQWLHDTFVFQIFLILVFGYLIESLLSPYERILEVRRRYARLFCAYTPYVLTLTILLSYNTISLIGLGNTLLCIQGVRLVSSLLMIPYARREYEIRFPTRFTTTLFMICLPIGVALYVVSICICG